MKTILSRHSVGHQSNHSESMQVHLLLFPLIGNFYLLSLWLLEF
jgi:hypothetical protein